MNPGRPRPPHPALSITCRNCGAAVTLKDDRARMRVCDYCHATLELSGVEQQVLGLGGPCPIAYRLQLGERLKTMGASYEVIARVCYIEDGDTDEQTHAYYLYHPRRAPMWLEDYRGELSLDQRTRVRPRTAFSPWDPRASSIATYDGRTWRREEQGVRETFHVDGSLPYVQRVGDRFEYVDFTGPSATYGAERAVGTGEIEYSRGRPVTAAEVAAWRGAPLEGLSGDAALRAAFHRSARSPLPAFAFGAVGIAAILAVAVSSCACESSGHEISSVVAHPVDLEQGALGPVFELPHEDTLLRIQLEAPLDNAWMYAQVALLEEDGDTVLHVTEADIAYYHGYEGGESWSEGSRDGSVYVTVPDPGRYRLMLGGASGYGESASTTPQHSLTARVFADAYEPSALYTSLFLLVPALVILGLVTLMLSTKGLRTGCITAAFGAVLLVGIGGVAAQRTLARAGAPELEHPDGISIRQSSLDGATGLPFFVMYDSGRAHLGGGVHAGK